MVILFHKITRRLLLPWRVPPFVNCQLDEGQPIHTSHKRLHGYIHTLIHTDTPLLPNMGRATVHQEHATPQREVIYQILHLWQLLHKKQVL